MFFSLDSNRTWSITRHVEMDTRQEKAILVGFQKIIGWHSQKPISNVKKSSFQTLTRPLFWLVESFLRILHARHTYVKCSLESKLTFDRTWSITRHVEMDTRQEKAILVGFQKSYPKIVIGLPAKCLDFD